MKYIFARLFKRSFYRKPNPGMLIKSINKFNIDVKKSYLVGDRWSDIAEKS